MPLSYSKGCVQQVYHQKTQIASLYSTHRTYQNSQKHKFVTFKSLGQGNVRSSAAYVCQTCIGHHIPLPEKESPNPNDCQTVINLWTKVS